MSKFRLFLCLFAMLSLVTATSLAQLSEGGSPPSFQRTMSAAADVEIMPWVDVGSMLAEDEVEELEGLPFRFGAPFDVNYDLMNAGQWDELPDGSGVWRLRIYSSGAFSINIIYDDFHLPPGAELFVYSEDREMVIGAFTERNNKKSGLFATAPVKGEDITIEYYEPSDVRGQGHFTVTRIVHAYKDIFGYGSPDKNYGDSGSCNVNINCPEGADWQLEKRSVAMVLLGNGTRWCTGSMVNNVRQDETPYFLTANHCLNGEENWIIMFRYESSGCTDQDGPTNYTIHGTTLRAANSYSDFALVELSSIPPQSYDVYYSGWTTSDVAASNVIAVHHPSGDLKKISFENDPVTSTEYLSSSAGQSHWRVADWDLGTTEGGSSGSPIYDSNHRIVGQLHGGYAACGNDLADWYGKVSKSWDYGGSSSTRLRDWLDPDNTGASSLDGYDPYANPIPNANFTGTPTTGDTPLTVLFTDQTTNTPTSWSWDFGDGIGTSTQQNPSYTYDSVGTYTVSLTATNAYGSDTETKVDYIVVTEPGTEAYAGSDIPVSGTVIGDYTATLVSDNSHQIIEEDETGGKPSGRQTYLEHKWSISVPQSTSLTFYLEGYRPSNPDGDNFTFAYSTDNSNFIDLLTVASSTEQVYAASIPSSVSGTVYIRVVDTDSTPGNRSEDRIYVDHMYIQFSSNSPPVADFTGSPTSGDEPLTVDFTDQSTNGPTSWSWDFGDGAGTSTAQNPSYTYSAAGTYTVSLTATNGYGSDDEVKTDYITVTPPSPPAADFVGSPRTGVVPHTVDFTDLSSGSPTSWSWDFGDGIGTSTQQNPSYTYDSVGTYTVTLTATNAYGSDSETKVDYVTVSDAGSDMYVYDIVVARVDAGGGNKRGQAVVTIYDNNGLPVSGATVIGDFTGVIPESGMSGITDAAGQTTIQTAGTVKNNAGDVCFEVTNVTHASYTYNPAMNNVTMSCQKAGDQLP